MNTQKMDIGRTDEKIKCAHFQKPFYSHFRFCILQLKAHSAIHLSLHLDSALLLLK